VLPTVSWTLDKAHFDIVLTFLYKVGALGAPQDAGAPCSGNYFGDVEIILKRTIS